mmetsp:Transcript_10447/g.40620  ORF Transcript_10447/g.40620 Transcript_10447/m.40620 type:complete len:274 (-) Transcript_10447:1392-2213(-)
MVPATESRTASGTGSVGRRCTPTMAIDEVGKVRPSKDASWARERWWARAAALSLSASEAFVGAKATPATGTPPAIACRVDSLSLSAAEPSPVAFQPSAESASASCGARAYGMKARAQAGREVALSASVSAVRSELAPAFQRSRASPVASSPAATPAAAPARKSDAVPRIGLPTPHTRAERPRSDACAAPGRRGRGTALSRTAPLSDLQTTDTPVHSAWPLSDALGDEHDPAETGTSRARSGSPLSPASGTGPILPAQKPHGARRTGAGWLLMG